MNKNVSNPLITVIIAYYNGAKYIEETIESIYRQTYKNFELIVVDDCSPDEFSQKYIKDLQEKFGFKLIHHNQNLGSAQAIQTAFEHAKGEYIVSTGQDDPMMPDKIEYQLKMMIEKDLDCLTCSGISLDEANGEKYPFDTRAIIEAQEKGQEAVIDLLESIDNMQWYSIQGSIYKRKVFEDTKWIRETYKQDDWPFVIYVWKNYKCYFENKPVYIYRNHVNGSHFNAYKILEYEISTATNFVSPKNKLETISWILINKGHLFLLQEDYNSAVRFILAGLFMAKNKSNIKYAFSLLHFIPSKLLYPYKKSFFKLSWRLNLINILIKRILRFLILFIPVKKLRKKIRKDLNL